MSTVYLYMDKTPNTQNEKYYLYDNMLTGLQSTLGTAALTATSDNYRLDNTGKLKVTFDTDANNKTNVNRLTYCIETDGNYTRYYHILNSKLISGYIECDLQIDNWATYMPRATLAEMHLTRCNRYTDGVRGIFDEIRNLKNKEIMPSFIPITIDGSSASENDLCVMFRVSESVKVYDGNPLSFIANEDTTYPATYVHYLANTVGTDTANRPAGYSGLSIQQYLLDVQTFVSNAFSRDISAHKDTAMYIEDAWLIPSRFIHIRDASPSDIKTFTADKTELTFKAYRVRPGETHGYIDVSPRALDVSNNKYEYKYVVGTRFNGISLRNFTDAHYYINLNIYQSNDTFKVEISHADDTIDVTNDFSIGLSRGQEGRTGIQMFTHGWQSLLSGPAGLLSLVGNIGRVIEDYSSVNKGRYQPGGNGFINSYIPDTQGNLTYYSGLYILKYESARNERTHAALTGVNYDYYLSSLILLNQWTKIHSSYETYLKMDCEVKNIPLDAANDIKSIFAGGLFLHDART